MKSAAKLVKRISDIHSVDLPRSAFLTPKKPSKPIPSPPLVQPAKEQLAKTMASFELFGELPFSLLSEIAAVSTVRIFHIGDLLWSRGEKVSDIYLLESGFVKLARRNPAGASKTYGLYGPGDSIGLFAMCAGMKHSVDAVAINEGLRTICLGAEDLWRFTNGSLTLSANLRDQVTRFTETLINKIEVIGAGVLPQRLALLMIQLVERYGVDRRDNQARLPFSLTLEHLSEIVDARIETVARVLSHWKRIGWLVIDSRGLMFPQLDAIYELLQH